MGAGTEAEWEAFVTSSWPGLVRTAAMLRGSPAAADELAAAALVRTRRRSRARDGGADPVQAWSQLARRTLLTLPATPRARLRAWRAGLGSAEAGDADEMLERYRALGRPQRALLVLTVAAGLDVAAAAAALGLSARTGAGELVTALDRLRPPAADRLGGGPVAELDLGDLTAETGTTTGADALLARDPVVGELRDAFALLAAAAPVAGDASRRVDLAATADRLSRRRRAAVAVCLSCTVAATTAVVVRENATVEAARQRAQHERAAYAASHPSVLSGDVSTWPTRGSRAADAGLLADVAARIGSRPAVLFAGDVVGVDVVVALTGPGEEPLLHVLAGSPGTPVDSWPEAGAGLVVGPGAVPVISAAVTDEQGRVHLLAVTLTSGVAIAYSPAPVLADDAGVSRRYLRLPVTDGVAAALVTARPGRLRMRVDGAGFEAIVAPLTVAGTASVDAAVPASTVASASPASCRRSPQVGDVPQLVREATGDAGLDGSDVTGVRLLWCRQDVRGGEAAVALTTARGPDIQCYESVDGAAGDMRTTSSRCWPVPRGTAASAPFLAPDLALGSPPSDVLGLTVFAPGAVTADVRAGPLASPPLAAARVAPDGYVRFAVPLKARTSGKEFQSEGIVVLRDAYGEAVDILPVRSRHLSDVWGEGADGPLVDQ